MTRVTPPRRSTAASAAAWFLRASTRPTWSTKFPFRPSSVSRETGAGATAGGLMPRGTTRTRSGATPYMSTRSCLVDSETAIRRRERATAHRVLRLR